VTGENSKLPVRGGGAIHPHLPDYTGGRTAKPHLPDYTGGGTAKPHLPDGAGGGGAYLSSPAAPETRGK